MDCSRRSWSHRWPPVRVATLRLCSIQFPKKIINIQRVTFFESAKVHAVSACWVLVNYSLSNVDQSDQISVFFWDFGNPSYRDKSVGGLKAAFDLERDQSTKGCHLFLGNGMAGMRRQAGIEDPIDVGMFFQGLGECQCVRTVPFHAQRQSPHAVMHLIRFKWRLKSITKVTEKSFIFNVSNHRRKSKLTRNVSIGLFQSLFQSINQLINRNYSFKMINLEMAL